MRSTVKGGKSSVSRHSIVISGRKTSVSLENEFWDGLKESAFARNIRLDTLVTKIDFKRQQANLSSAIRLFVLDFYQSQITLSAKPRANRPPLPQSDEAANSGGLLFLLSIERQESPAEAGPSCQ